MKFIGLVLAREIQIRIRRSLRDKGIQLMDGHAPL